MNILISDSLTCGDGSRNLTRDFIGTGPRTLASLINRYLDKNSSVKIRRGEEIIAFLNQLRNFSKSNLDIKKFDLDPKDIDILMISAMTMDEKSVNNLIQMWKNESDSIILLGGPIAADPKILFHIKADFAMIGESERNIQDLMLGINKNSDKQQILNILKHLPNITYLKDGIPICTMKDNFLSESEFEIMKTDPVYITHYSDYRTARVYVECVRGCSNYRRTSLSISGNVCASNCGICRGNQFQTTQTCPSQVPPGCGFCSTLQLHGPVRSKKVETLISEIKGLISLGVTRIVLGGPDFLDYRRELLVPNGQPLINPNPPPNPNIGAINELISQILEIQEIKERNAFVFIENVKGSLCSNEVLESIAKLPDPIFSIGCETGSAKFADILGRPNTPQVTLDAVRRAIRKGIRVHVYFIHGLPGDKIEFVKETLNLLNEFAKLNVDKITIYKYQEIPGSPFFQRNYNERKMSVEPKLYKWENKIKNFAISYNEKKKQEMIHKTYRILVSEINKFNQNDAIGIIMEGGPKVSIQNAANLVGTVQTVKITKVISDKLVEAAILSDNS